MFVVVYVGWSVIVGRNVESEPLDLHASVPNAMLVDDVNLLSAHPLADLLTVVVVWPLWWGSPSVANNEI